MTKILTEVIAGNKDELRVRIKGGSAVTTSDGRALHSLTIEVRFIKKDIPMRIILQIRRYKPLYPQSFEHFLVNEVVWKIPQYKTKLVVQILMGYAQVIQQALNAHWNKYWTD